MFEVRIATATEALDLMKEGWPTRVISLVGDDLRFELPILGPHHFVARFHDVEADVPGYTASTEAMMRAALHHTSRLSSHDRLLVHCHAGKSRSPAMTLGVLVSAGLPPTEAMAVVKKLRPFVIPNRLMVQQLDVILEQDGRLISAVAAHYATLPADAVLPNRGGLND